MHVVLSAEFVEHTDDLVAAKVGGIAHRRTPIAVANGGVLVQQVGMLDKKRAHGVDIVAPDRVDEFAGLDEPRPVWRSITTRESKLRISELRLVRRYRFWVIRVEFLDRDAIAFANGAE